MPDNIHNNNTNDDEYPFDYIILKERFNEVCDAIEDLGISDLSEDSLMSELSSLLNECKELETPVRDSLERICENAVNRLFAIPEGILNIKCKLVDKIKFKKRKSFIWIPSIGFIRNEHPRNEK